MSRAKAAVPVKAKAAVPSTSAPRKASAEDDDGRKKALPAAAAKKPMAQMSEAEMREEVKRMMAATKKPTSTAAPAPTAATPSNNTALKAPQQAAQPQSPPLKSAAPPKSPVVPAVKPGAPPPLKPLERTPVEQPTGSSKPAAAAPQPTKPALAALDKQPAAAAKKAEEKEAESEDEDYYDEDFDEDAATIDEEDEPQPPPQAVPALPAAPVLSSPNMRIRALNASPAESATYMPPTPRTALLVSEVQGQISQEDTPLSARGKPSSWKSPRSPLPAASAKPRSQQQAPQTVVEEVRRVVLPSAKQVKAGLTRNEDVKRLKRAAWVLQRVERVEEAFELFSLQPSSQYDVWMREVGRGEKRNAGCQYSDDWRDEEVQTDATQAEDEDTQAPEDQFVSRLTVRESEKREDGGGDDAIATAEEKKREANGANIGTRLNWLHAASQLIEALLEENVQQATATSVGQSSVAAVSTRYPHLRASPASLSSLVLGQFPITPPAIFGPRQVRAVHLSSLLPDQLLLALSPIQPTAPPTDTALYQGLAHCSLLLLYDLSALASPPFPSKLLYCQGSVSCVGVESERGWCVVAGLEEGSVCVWDLREADGLHRRWLGSMEGVKQPVVLRHASFTSDGPFATSGGETRNHTAAVTAIRFVTQSARSKPSANTESIDPTQADNGSVAAPASSSAGRSFDIFSLSSSSGNDFSFVTLDSNGLLLSWSAIEARDASLAGSETDLTLAIGSTLKLVRTHGKQHSSRPPPTSTAERGEGEPSVAGSAHALQLCSGDTDEYIVALSGGRLCKEKRYGGRSAPARFSLLPSMGSESEEAGVAAEGEGVSVDGVDEVTCIASHPLFDEYFLAGYGSGLVALYSLHSSVALQLFFPSTAKSSSAIVSLQWHPSSSASFIALTATNALTVHNLLAVDSSAQPPAATVVQLSGVDCVGVGKGGRGGWMAGVCSTSEAAGRGRVEVYGLKGDDGRAADEENKAVSDYLRRLR